LNRTFISKAIVYPDSEHYRSAGDIKGIPLDALVTDLAGVEMRLSVWA